MSTIRPEVLAFLRAAEALNSSEDLSDDETDKIVEVVTQLNKLLMDGEVSPDGDGHP